MFFNNLFSLASIPPLAGFFAKFYIFTAVIEQSMFFLAIVGLLSTVIAAFYYLRIIKIIYFDTERETFDKDHNISLKLSLFISTVVIIFYFIYPSTLNRDYFKNNCYLMKFHRFKYKIINSTNDIVLKNSKQAI